MIASPQHRVHSSCNCLTPILTPLLSFPLTQEEQEADAKREAADARAVEAKRKLAALAKARSESTQVSRRGPMTNTPASTAFCRCFRCLTAPTSRSTAVDMVKVIAAVVNSAHP